MTPEQTLLYNFLGELATEIDHKPTKIMDMSRTGLSVMGLAMEYCKRNTLSSEPDMPDAELIPKLAEVIRARGEA